MSQNEIKPTFSEVFIATVFGLYDKDKWHVDNTGIIKRLTALSQKEKSKEENILPENLIDESALLYLSPSCVEEFVFATFGIYDKDKWVAYDPEGKNEPCLYPRKTEKFISDFYPKKQKARS